MSFQPFVRNFDLRRCYRMRPLSPEIRLPQVAVVACVELRRTPRPLLIERLPRPINLSRVL
jgi:hypothetical protein